MPQAAGEDESMAMETEPAVATAKPPSTNPVTDLRLPLTTVEKEIFDMLLSVVNDRTLGTTIRVAGGWVRDKVCVLSLMRSMPIPAQTPSSCLVCLFVFCSPAPFQGKSRY